MHQFLLIIYNFFLLFCSMLFFGCFAFPLIVFLGYLISLLTTIVSCFRNPILSRRQKKILRRSGLLPDYDSLIPQQKLTIATIKYFCVLCKDMLIFPVSNFENTVFLPADSIKSGSYDVVGDRFQTQMRENDLTGVTLLVFISRQDFSNISRDNYSDYLMKDSVVFRKSYEY